MKKILNPIVHLGMIWHQHISNLSKKLRKKLENEDFHFFAKGENVHFRVFFPQLFAKITDMLVPYHT